MKLRTLAAVGALALALAACTDQAVEPALAPPGAPRLDNRVASVSIKDPAYASLVSNGDWTNAIRAAVAAARAVYFPADSYAVTGTITLTTGTRVYGDGPGSLLHQKSAASSIFVASGTSSAFVDSLTIDHLRFRGPSGFFAADLKTVRHLSFTDNQANVIGLVHVNTHLPINVGDLTVDPAATAGLTSESHLSRHISILRNRATGSYVLGQQQTPIPFAIYIQYAADGAISNTSSRTTSTGSNGWAETPTRRAAAFRRTRAGCGASPSRTTR